MSQANLSFSGFFDIAAPAWLADGARGDIGGGGSNALIQANLTTPGGNASHQPGVSPAQTFIVLQGMFMLLFPFPLGNKADVDAIDGALTSG